MWNKQKCSFHNSCPHHIRRSAVVVNLRQFISSLLLRLFSLCLSKHSIALHFSAAQSQIFRLLLRGKEMNRERENWSPSVTTGVVSVLKATGCQEIRLTFRLGLCVCVCVYPIICYLDGSACTVPSRWDLPLRRCHTTLQKRTERQTVRREREIHDHGGYTLPHYMADGEINEGKWWRCFSKWDVTPIWGWLHLTDERH